MTSSTHTIVSTISICAMNLLGGTPLHPAPIAIGALASILPDIDEPRSRMGRFCPPVSHWLYRKVGHRTLTHGVFGWVVAAVVFLPLKFLPTDVPLYGAAMVGFVSHGLLDLANLEGVALTYPLFPHHRWVFPGDVAYRVKQRSSREDALRIVGALLMTGLLALNLAGGRALFHSFLGTPAAIARDHASQLKHDYWLLVRVEGVWMRGQTRVSERFEVIGSTDAAIFVRRPSEGVLKVSGAMIPGFCFKPNVGPSNESSPDRSSLRWSL
jgi:inner membrane protein